MEKPVRAKRGKIPVWAERYGYGERQIKNWLAAGRESGKPPPFDHPERMPEWFTAHHTQKVPQRLLDAVEKLGRGETLGATQPASASPSVPDATPFVLPTVGAHEIGDLETQLNGYRREWALIAKLREDALVKGELSKASGYLTQQQLVSQEIRQLEKLLPDVLRQRGDTLSVAETKAETIDLLKVLRQALLNHGLKAVTRLRAAVSDTELAALWKSEIESVFASCCSAGFEEVLTLDAA